MKGAREQFANIIRRIQMHIKTFSYRYAEEILQHPRYRVAYDETMRVCEGCLSASYEGESGRLSRLDIVQQRMNACFWIALSNLGWERSLR